MASRLRPTRGDYPSAVPIIKGARNLWDYELKRLVVSLEHQPLKMVRSDSAWASSSEALLPKRFAATLSVASKR